MRPGNSASSTLKRSATISGAWFGSITPPEPIAHVPRHRGDLPDHDVGRRARDRREIVVLGHPVAGIAERVGVAREVEAVGERLRAGRTAGDGGEIENGQKRHDAGTMEWGSGNWVSDARIASKARRGGLVPPI